MHIHCRGDGPSSFGVGHKEAGREKTKLSRREKWQNRLKNNVNPKETPLGLGKQLPLMHLIFQRKNCRAQTQRWTQWKAASGHPSSAGVGFFERDGLVYRHGRMPGQQSEDIGVDQLIRGVVLQMAHDIPFAGHLGKEKTAQWILQRFYWPTLYHDVAKYC